MDFFPVSLPSDGYPSGENKGQKGLSLLDIYILLPYIEVRSILAERDC